MMVLRKMDPFAWTLMSVTFWHHPVTQQSAIVLTHLEHTNAFVTRDTKGEVCLRLHCDAISNYTQFSFTKKLFNILINSKNYRYCVNNSIAVPSYSTKKEKSLNSKQFFIYRNYTI